MPELDNEEDTSYFDSECSSSCLSFVRVRPVSSSLSVILYSHYTIFAGECCCRVERLSEV